MITQAELKEVLEYNPDTGVFTWKKTVNSRAVAGSVAGGKNTEGYINLKINRKNYQAHRLAYLYMTGNFPENFIDHINHTKDDNRWVNLRDATNSQNQANAKKPITNKSGYKGARWHKTNKRWCAEIRYMKKKMHLGYYTTPEEASEAYKKKAIEIHGEFSCTE
jgi:HNH endonuclease/AP2 domain